VKMREAEQRLKHRTCGLLWVSSLSLLSAKVHQPLASNSRSEVTRRKRLRKDQKRIVPRLRRIAWLGVAPEVGRVCTKAMGHLGSKNLEDARECMRSRGEKGNHRLEGRHTLTGR
jgi:hypothetical protein